MPGGCDFTCEIEDCEYFNTGFTIIAPWPMGKIDDVINSSRVGELPEFKAKMIKFRESGRDLACIAFPNADKVQAQAYRVTLWSVEGNCLWQYDVPLNGESVSSAIEEAKLPDKCPTTGSEMIDYKESIKRGINCPKCGNQLKQNRWFSKG